MHLYMNDKKVAVVTGVTGQDGAYLVELIIKKKYSIKKDKK